MSDDKKINKLTMETPVKRVPLCAYPRPQLKRDSFICLNGLWNDVVVPFPLESELSGYKGKDTANFTYERSFSVPKDFIKDKVLLHFGAVDTKVAVSIDGALVGSHEGGYLPFCFDITEHVQADKEHTLKVFVTDEQDEKYPYGKQRKKRGGMWYTPVSGIWQSVWLESVTKDYIEAVEITPHLDGIELGIFSEAKSFNILIEFKGEKIFEMTTEDKDLSIAIDEAKLWTPENPNLYDITITTAEGDCVKTYFGLRTVSIGTVDGIKRILLNGKPYFFHGVLDQGYFPEGIYTPNDESVYEEDILRLKSLGINTIRKHIKIEPEAFYEACDRLGMLVFQDMVNNGRYSFIHDTAMPTIGLKRWNDKKKHFDEDTVDNFVEGMTETVTLLYNHPSVVYYTIFNEGWGQYDADLMYEIVKSMDRSRIVDATSGWFWQSESDVDSYHVYFKPVKVENSDRPIIISEFGGYSYKIPEHSFNRKKNYGYGKAANSKTLTDMIEKLYRTEIIPAIDKGVCGTIYTQATDVEDETNGFYTYDRKVCKVEVERMRKLSEDLKI